MHRFAVNTPKTHSGLFSTILSMYVSPFIDKIHIHVIS